MHSTFPFQITTAPAAAGSEFPLLIFADVGGLEEYYVLFQNHGYGGTANSWVEHIENHCPRSISRRCSMSFPLPMAATPLWPTPAARPQLMHFWPACSRFSAPSHA